MNPAPPVTRIFIQVTLIEAEVVKAVRADSAPALVRGLVKRAGIAAEVSARLPDDGGTVAIRITRDEEMARLNAAYTGEDHATDALSFTGAGSQISDLAISWPAVFRQSNEYGHASKTELALLAVHGLLHLLGWDHATASERREMNRLTRAA